MFDGVASSRTVTVFLKGEGVMKKFDGTTGLRILCQVPSAM